MRRYHEMTDIARMLPFNRISAIRRFIKQEGAAATLSRAMTSLAGLVYRHERAYILVRPTAVMMDPPVQSHDVRIALLQMDQVDSLAAIAYHRREEILRRLHNGQKCIVAEYKGDIVHYSWLTAAEEYAAEIEKMIPVEAGERYLFNCRTLAPARGRGIFPLAIARALEVAGTSGASHIITLVSSSNKSSLKAFAKMAFTVREEITMTRFLVFRKHRIQGVKNHV